MKRQPSMGELVSLIRNRKTDIMYIRYHDQRLDVNVRSNLVTGIIEKKGLQQFAENWPILIDYTTSPLTRKFIKPKI